MSDADPDGGQLHFEANSARQMGAIVRISVEIVAEGRPPPAYSFVNIHTEDLALSLKCSTNCNPDSHVIAEELRLYTDDLLADYWTLVESPPEFLDTYLDASVLSSTEIIVRPDFFWAAGYYTIRLEDNAYYADSPRISEWRFRVPVNPWRSSGDPATYPCRLIPPVGVSLVDLFCITCDDYVDEYGPVQMEVKYEFIPAGVDTPTAVFPGDDPPIVIDFIMTLYTGWVGYTSLVDIAPGTVIIILRAFSIDGRYTEVTLPPIEISAPSLDQLTGYLAGLYDNGEGTFYSLLAMGAAEDAFLSAVTAAGALGSIAAGGGDVEQAVAETIASMSQVPIQDYESVNGVASVLLLVTAFPDQLSPESMVLASSLLKSSFEKLRELSGNSTILPVADVIRAAASMFSAVGNVFMASQTMALSEREAGITFSDVLEASKDATTTGFEGLDVLDDILLNALMPEFTDQKYDEIFADFYTSQVHIRIQRQDRGILEEKVFQVGGASDCLIRVPSLPPLIGDRCPPEETVGVQFYESNFNPFEYSNNSKEIETDIPGLSVKCGDRTLQVSNLREPIDILTRREDKNLDDFIFMFKSSAPLGKVSTFPFFAKKNMSSIGILVKFNNTIFPQPVTMYLSKHIPPTKDDFNWTTTLPVPDNQLFSIKWINDTFLTADPYQWHLPEDEIAITDADVVNMTEYHVGVQFGSDLDVGSGGVVNFTLSVFETSCVYFAEEPVHLWESDGCSTGVMSNMTHMHCRCDHLTKFSGFVAPNPLNIQEALSANILENPAGLILVLATFGSYLFLLLFSRKADRKDLTKTGVGLLPGHRLNPRKDCQYVITVYTGFKGNAGTTAEISIVLCGFEESSPTITLRDPKRILFEQGSVDSFLVSTEQPLRGLAYMRVWHNNAGYSPAWFLNQVIVVNRGTNETTYFLANRWLAVDEDDGKIDRIIPTASLEDMTKFRNVFLAKSARDMNDGHLWFSVKGRPARSPFTRVQRLSCCLTLLYSSMITNIMFFGRGDDFDPPEPLRIAGLEIDPPISLPQLMIGIQSAAISLPVNLLIVFFFRNSGKRPKTNASNKNEQSKPSDGILTSSGKTPKSELALSSNVPTIPSDYCPTNRPTVGLKMRRANDTITHDVQSPVEVQTNERERKAVKGKEEKPEPEKKSSLPWWTVYLGWLLVWSASFVAAFFTVLYTLSFGKAKAEAWVFTFVTSFFTDLFLVQPFKLMLVAMVFALLTRKPIEDEEPPAAPVEEDEEYIQTDDEVEKVQSERRWGSATGWMRYMGMTRAQKYTPDSKSPDDERSTLPPDESVLAEARAKSAEKRKRRTAVLEVIVFGLFVTVIMLTAYQERSPLAFYMTQNVKEQIVEGDFSDINDIPSFWSWIEGDLIPTTRTSEWYNGQANADDNVLQDMLTHPLDAVQLRQVRLKPGQHCETPEKMQEFAPRCTVRHSTLTADTDDYIQGWIPYNDTINSTDTVICAPTVPPLTSTVSTPVTGANCTVFLTREETDTPWMYRFASLIGSFPYFGQHGTYLTGGYSTPLGKTRTTGLRLATFLKEHNWLDERTRAVFVEVILYNPHANLFSVVTLVVEFTNLGAAYRGAEVVTLRLIQQDAILLFALRAVLAVFILLFAIKEAKGLFARPIEYLSDFWSWVELLVIAIGFSSLGVYFNAQSIIDQAVEQRTTSESVFEIYKSAVNWFQIYTYLLAFLICCATLKFIRLLRFNSHVYALSVTIKKSFKPVLQFFFVAAIIIMAFTQMGNLLFGIKLQDYKNILTSLTSLCTMMLGSFDFDTLVDGHYILGPLMFFVYQALMQFVLLSMFMTIIMDVYAEEIQDPNTDDLQMFGFIRETTSDAVGKANRSLTVVGKSNSTKALQDADMPDLDNRRKFATVLKELDDVSKN
ncbi:polycystin-1-like protein 2 [Branchiostoma lanceolatum]|uniref:polycystin-1-like protein 2 n=1 Tax=Branchiostoma lanceolatum TaxID=7740 RepID=UPI003452EB77